MVLFSRPASARLPLRWPDALRAAIGTLSLASGVALLLRPRPLGRLYGLPPDASLLRALGARDVLVGLLTLAPARAAWGLRGRAASDLLDGALIVWEARRRPRPLPATCGRVAVAMGSAVLAGALRSP
jgi:hypothetical protein